MPKIVDHDARRRAIVDAVIRVTARAGLAQVTSRAVAGELGVSVGSLWHYYDNFDAIVDDAGHEVARRTMARIRAATSGRRGLARIDAMVEELLPLRPDTRDEAFLIVGLWGRVALGESAQAPRDRELWAPDVAEALAEAVADGDLRPDAPIDGLAEVFHALTLGQQVVEVVDDVTAADHRRVVETWISPWLARTAR